MGPSRVDFCSKLESGSQLEVKRRRSRQWRSFAQVSRGFKGRGWPGQYGSGARERALPRARTRVLAVASPQPSVLADREEQGLQRRGEETRSAAPLGCWQFQGKGQDGFGQREEAGQGAV